MESFFEALSVEISDDQTKAYLTLAEPSKVPANFEVAAPALNDFLRNEHQLIALDEERIKELVVEFNASREPFEKIEIADTGKPAIDGADAHLEWMVEQEATLSEDDKGRVDFYSYSALKNVSEGQPLAVFHPLEPGTNGQSVTAEAIEAKPGKDRAFQAGDNVDYNEEERTFYATVNGRMELRQSTLVVSRLYEVDADVDFSTGNIAFDGFVRVKGDIQDNFSVNAHEGVQVDGSIQAGHVTCGGSISAIGGINSRNKGTLRTDADLRAKFINNSNIEARGDIIVEREIVNSEVRAKNVSADAGSITGGQIIASGDVTVNEAGSDMAVRTVIHAGYDRHAEEELEKLREELKKRETLMKRVYGKLDILKDIIKELREEKRDAVYAMEMRIETLAGSLKELEADAEERRKTVHNMDAEIEVMKTIYPGVVLRIGKYEKSIGQKFEGYRRWGFDKNKYEIVPHFEPSKNKKRA